MITAINIQNGKAVTHRKTFSRETVVNININADKAIIWKILTNTQDYTRWNSTIKKLEGQIAKGHKISLISTTDESRTFKLQVTTLDAEKLMIWESGMMPFFKGVRTYQLTQNPDSSVTFMMAEKIGGLMFPMAAKHIPPFDAVFEQFAADLKKEAEQSQR